MKNDLINLVFPEWLYDFWLNGFDSPLGGTSAEVNCAKVYQVEVVGDPLSVPSTSGQQKVCVNLPVATQNTGPALKGAMSLVSTLYRAWGSMTGHFKGGAKIDFSDSEGALAALVAGSGDEFNFRTTSQKNRSRGVRPPFSGLSEKTVHSLRKSPVTMKGLPTDFELSEAVHFWWKHFLSDTWASLFKERSAWIFAKAEGCVLPDLKFAGNPKYLVPGQWGLRMFLYANKTGKMARMWRLTILQGIKKGLPSVSENFVKDQLKGLKIDLETEIISPYKILKCIERTSNEIFWDMSLAPDVSIQHKVSVASCYESNRALGGPQGELYRRTGIGCSDEEFIGFYPYHPRLNAKPQEMYTNKILRLEKIVEERVSAILEPQCVPTDWEAVPLLEPLKVRPITRGPFVSNGCFKDVQVDMWSSLQKYEQFHLTAGMTPGKTFTPLFTRNYIVDEYDALGLDDYGWKSGDFSAATNKLHSDCTVAALHGIKDVSLKGLLLDNLTGSVIHFPKKYLDPEEGLDTFLMKNGQLMGSQYSFPLLCVVNLAIFRYALEQWTGRRWKIRDLPVLVNGDDILFLCTERFEKFWHECVRACGLIPSKGKDYWSTHFAMVNSTYIQVNPTDVREFIGHVPFINMGIYNGVHKGEATVKGDTCVKSLREKLACLPGYFRDLFYAYDSCYDNVYDSLINGILEDRWDVALVRSRFSLLHLGLKKPFKTVMDHEELFWLDNHPTESEVEDWIRKEENVREISREKKKIGGREKQICSAEGALFFTGSSDMPALPRKILRSSERKLREFGDELGFVLGTKSLRRPSDKDLLEDLLNEAVSSKRFRIGGTWENHFDDYSRAASSDGVYTLPCWRTIFN